MIENFIDRFVPSKDEREFLKDKSATFSDVEQACAISDMRMSAYTALEKAKIKKEIQEILMKM